MDSAQGHENSQSSLSEGGGLCHSASLLNEKYFSDAEFLGIHILRHWAKNNRLAFPSMSPPPLVKPTL